MSYSALFINKNFKIFKEWILRFINSKNRWKIIFVTNSNINTNIYWSYKFFHIPDYIVENRNNFSQPLIANLSKGVKNNNLIFFILASPTANILVSYPIQINNKITKKQIHYIYICIYKLNKNLI
jgi:hypothetical protein